MKQKETPAEYARRKAREQALKRKRQRQKKRERQGRG